MLTQQKANGGLAKPGPKSVDEEDRFDEEDKSAFTNDRTVTLADAGISKDLSSRAQKLAAVPEAEFEAEIGEWSDNKIAKDFGFSHPFVGNVRGSLSTVDSDKPTGRTYTTSPP